MNSDEAGTEGETLSDPRRGGMRTTFRGGLVLVVAMLVTSVALWGRMEGATAPAHWSPGGVTRYAERAEGLLFPPGALAALLLLFWFVPSFESDPARRRRSGPALAACMALTSAMMLAIYVNFLSYGFDRPLGLLPGPFLVLTGVGLVIVMVIAFRTGTAWTGQKRRTRS